MKLLASLLILIAFLVASPACHSFCFEEAAKESGINPGLLRSIAKVESGMRPNATNRNKNGSTDLGLMQINSSWIGPMKLDRERLMNDPCYNVRTGAVILRQCIDKHGYTWEAVGCYNAFSKGKRVVYSWKIYRQLKKEGEDRKDVAHGSRHVADKRKQSLQFKVIEDRNVSAEDQ